MKAELADGAQPADRGHAPDSPTIHIITSEFPPTLGGVSDHVARLSAELGRLGHRVHVWCPGQEGDDQTIAGVVVHRRMGDHSLADLKRLDLCMSAHAAPRRLLLQWVPHGFGWRSMNVPLCLWLLKRSVIDRDVVEIMVHEPFLEFAGNVRQYLAASVHRMMTILLLRAADRVWLSTPRWQKHWGKYGFPRRIDYTWLPISSSIEPTELDVHGVHDLRARFQITRPLIGSFTGLAASRSDARVRELEPVFARLASGRMGVDILFIGQNSRKLCHEVALAHPTVASRLHATGAMTASELSIALHACDLLLQCYPDGVTSRRATAVTALAHGVPILATSGVNTESFWSESDSVALVPVGDTDGMSTAAERLLAEPVERARLGAAARLLYAQMFSLNRSIALIGAISRAPPTGATDRGSLR